MDEAKFERLSKRLQQKTDPNERGGLLPRTGAALEESAAADRLVAIVEALGTERVIVPVPVEAHPQSSELHLLEDSGEYRPQELGEDAQVPLPRGEQGVLVFTSADQLRAWDCKARPMAMASRKAALTALMAGGSLWLDPAGAGLVIPRPAVTALAVGETWLPAWRDQELLEELREIASNATWASFIDLAVKPAQDPAAVRVEVNAASGAPGRLERRDVELLLASLSTSPRLQAATDCVEFVPRLIPLV